jgi:hypothetical protein
MCFLCKTSVENPVRDGYISVCTVCHVEQPLPPLPPSLNVDMRKTIASTPPPKENYVRPFGVFHLSQYSSTQVRLNHTKTSSVVKNCAPFGVVADALGHEWNVLFVHGASQIIFKKRTLILDVDGSNGNTARASRDNPLLPEVYAVMDQLNHELAYHLVTGESLNGYGAIFTLAPRDAEVDEMDLIIRCECGCDLAQQADMQQCYHCGQMSRDLYSITEEMET